MPNFENVGKETEKRPDADAPPRMSDRGPIHKTPGEFLVEIDKHKVFIPGCYKKLYDELNSMEKESQQRKTQEEKPQEENRFGKAFIGFMKRQREGEESQAKENQERMDTLRGLLTSTRAREDAIKTQFELHGQQAEHLFNWFKRRFGENPINQLLEKREQRKIAQSELKELGLPSKLEYAMEGFTSYSETESIPEALMRDIDTYHKNYRLEDIRQRHADSIDQLRGVHFDDLKEKNPDWYQTILPEINEVTQLTRGIQVKLRELEYFCRELESSGRELKSSKIGDARIGDARIGDAKQLRFRLENARNQSETALLKAETSLVLASTASYEYEMLPAFGDVDMIPTPRSKNLQSCQKEIEQCGQSKQHLDSLLSHYQGLHPTVKIPSFVYSYFTTPPEVRT